MFGNTIFFCIALCIVTICFELHLADDTIGPADVTLLGVEECETPEQYEHPFNLSFKKFNRTHAGFTGCYKIPTDMDITYTLNITSSKWGDGGWKPNAFDFFGEDVCDLLSKHTKDQWATVAEHTGADPECPLKQGQYCVENLVVPLGNLMPSMIYGKFRNDIVVERGDTPFACVRVSSIHVRSKDAVKMIKT